MAGVDIALAVGGQPVSDLFDVEKHTVFHLISDGRLTYCMVTKINLETNSKKILHFYLACIKSPQLFNLRPLKAALLNHIRTDRGAR